VQIGRSGGRLIAVAVGLAALAVPAAAHGAVTIGSDLKPGEPIAGAACGTGPCTSINAVLPDAQKTSPIDGVIVRWRLRQGAQPAGPGALRVVREVVGPDIWMGIRTGPTETLPAAAGTFTFDARLPISAGDAIGLDHPQNHSDIVVGSSTAEDVYFDGTLVDGTTRSSDNRIAVELLLNADVEPDCDNDGFGDETQDDDISSCTPDTNAPNATITKAPKDKTKKRTATFEFTSTEPGSTFECILDGKSTFKPCISPFTVKVKRGRHAFQVQATDQAGNTDPSPATDNWKVKKKRKR
jgi:hypothetical protein